MKYPSAYLLLLCSFKCFAWNALGHQLVAQIALMQLTDTEQAQLWHYNQACHLGFQPRSLTQAAVWLDWLHCKEAYCQRARYYHYIDYPYSVDGTPGAPPKAVNALTAIQQAKLKLQHPQISDEEKGWHLRVLMHVVADVHQPMHTVSLYSQAFPMGDAGGNRFKLGNNRIAPQLHAYWDRGGGYLTSRRGHYPDVKAKAKRLLRRYPCQIETMNLDPTSWAQESFQLAKTQAYQLKPFERPPRAYQHRVRAVSAQRLSLAGCRLAALLKSIGP